MRYVVGHLAVLPVQGATRSPLGWYVQCTTEAYGPGCKGTIGAVSLVVLDWMVLSQSQPRWIP